MSIRQEKMKAQMWESTHKEEHEKDIKKLQTLKAELAVLKEGTPEYNLKKEDYDKKYSSAESFYMKFSD